MINPNHQSQHYGRVTKLTRDHNDSLNVTVVLVTGQTVTELGFIYHRTLKVGDVVTVTIGYSIMSNRYGIKAVRKTRKDAKVSFAAADYAHGRKAGA